MINNVRLKKMLKSLVFPIFTQINKIIPKDENLVLLYSANKGVVFCNLVLRDYLLRNRFDKKYKIVCGIENMCYADDTENVTFVSGVKSVWTFCMQNMFLYCGAASNQAFKKAVCNSYAAW